MEPNSKSVVGVSSNHHIFVVPWPVSRLEPFTPRSVRPNELRTEYHFKCHLRYKHIILPSGKALVERKLAICRSAIEKNSRSIELAVKRLELSRVRIIINEVFLQLTQFLCLLFICLRVRPFSTPGEKYNLLFIKCLAMH